MHYKFPEIRTIDDVLPHIKGRSEFIVVEREFGTVINYVVSMPDTFDMSGPDDLGGAIRRECRGILFDKNGKILSRPFHKFFNISEREETQIHNLDMTQPHVIMEKMDGSMIRPVLMDGELYLGTKMGITDIANDALAWLNTNGYNYKGWLRSCVENDITPLFEWISPKNQIVISYDNRDLVLLACRNNVTGEYFMPNDDDVCPFTIVPQYGSLNGNLGEYIERQRKAEGREGDIIRFSNGHMYKVKNDWYVRIHKTMDMIRFDRNIVDLIINENVDDVVPMLPESEAEKVHKFEERFWTAFKQKENQLYGLRINAQQSYNDDRKRIALEMVPHLENKADSGFVFKMLDGHDLRELMLEHIKKNISTNVKWESYAKWMGMNDD